MLTELLLLGVTAEALQTTGNQRFWRQLVSFDQIFTYKGTLPTAHFYMDR